MNVRTDTPQHQAARLTMAETLNSDLQILDGPMGTELNARGVPTPLPGWSAHALQTHPELVQQIHRDYATAGATIHTTNTFRTHARQFPDTWRALTDRAVELARAGLLGFDCRLAGSMSPLEDCYRPDLSPAAPREEHRSMARALCESGVDLLLVETFSHVGEAMIAVQEGLETDLPTWVSLTAGPDADLLSVEELRSAAATAIGLGAEAVMVNCVPAASVAGFLEGIRDLGVPFGAYGNAGFVEERSGWQTVELAPAAYRKLAEGWRGQGATILGSCCGTGIKHIEMLRGLSS